jgi:hypothetical protein
MKTHTVKFDHQGAHHEFNFLADSKEPDQWDTFYSKNKEGNLLCFDVNYDKNYNFIVVYLVNPTTGETDYKNTIHKQTIKN